ncbi:MAG: MOSC domain-containing protein [Acetobacteraceae bacterium]|nr:MOSC domain-containing protein [Acetobacteraceae bacterium]
MRVEYLYRYPVKGLTAEALESAEVETDGCIPWDRAFALAQGDSGFDPAAPRWLQKANFMCHARNAKIAALASFFEPRDGTLTIRAPDGSGVSANALSEAGRARLSAFLTSWLGEDARGVPAFQHVPGHSFCDQREKVVSLINMASLHDFEAKVGARRHRRRFRANVWFSGAAPWAERTWVGQEIQLGGAVLRITKGIVRCPATEVNPETAERDANPVEELRHHYGHTELGIHAKVVEGGRFAIGDALEILGD